MSADRPISGSLPRSAVQPVRHREVSARGGWQDVAMKIRESTSADMHAIGDLIRDWDADTGRRYETRRRGPLSDREFVAEDPGEIVGWEPLAGPPLRPWSNWSRETERI